MTAAGGLTGSTSEICRLTAADGYTGSADNSDIILSI
jgi:hypothetical protein